MPIQHINPPGLLQFDAMSQVVATSGGRTVYIAGQSASDVNFEVVGGNDYYAQSVQALRNLRTAVEAAGGGVENIVSSTVYLKNLTPKIAGRFLEALATACEGKPFPPHAFSLIGVASLAGADLLVEITAVAVIDAAVAA